MSILVLQVFVSLMLVAGSVLLFVLSVKGRDFEHADRLSLFPLDDDAPKAPREPTSKPPATPAAPR